MVLRCDHLDDGVAVLTLDRPEARNALSPELRQALRDSLDRLAGEPSVRALVLTGAGESFCAGGDIKTMGERDPEANKARMEQVASCALALARFPRPVVAAVAGHAAGAGVSLACLCDIILAEESARFAFLFLNVGLGPDWGLSHTLPRRVGSAAARRLLLTRASLPAPEAAALGLVDRICAPGQMLDEARALAAQLAAGPPEATAQVKALMSDIEALQTALTAETALQLTRFQSAEHHEGVAAFREKRQAKYPDKS